MLDPAIVNALVAPARADGELDEREDQLLQWIAEGRPVKAIAVGVEHHARSGERRDRRSVPEAREGSERGRESALRRLRLLQKAIVDREEQGETLSRHAARAGSPRSCAATATRSARPNGST